MTNTLIMSNKAKESIVKGTKEGALYLEATELFKQEDVKELVFRLMTSELRKRILEHRRAR